MSLQSNPHQPLRGARLKARIARLLGVEAEPPNKTHDGVQDGARDGDGDGAEHGHQDGLQNGLCNRVQHGALNGHHHWQQGGGDEGTPNGTLDGEGQPFDIALIGDTLVDLPPDRCPPLDAKEHALSLLEWLQETDMAGHWVRRSLLEKLYMGRFLREFGLSPEPWPTVAHHFRKLRGVKVRQKDGRKGSSRKGSSPLDYWIPKSVVVERASVERVAGA